MFLINGTRNAHHTANHCGFLAKYLIVDLKSLLRGDFEVWTLFSCFVCIHPQSNTSSAPYTTPT